MFSSASTQVKSSQASTINARRREKQRGRSAQDRQKLSDRKDIFNEFADALPKLSGICISYVPPDKQKKRIRKDGTVSTDAPKSEKLVLKVDNLDEVVALLRKEIEKAVVLEQAAEKRAASSAVTTVQAPVVVAE